MDMTSRAAAARGSSERGLPRETLKTSAAGEPGSTEAGSSSSEKTLFISPLYLESSGTMTPTLIPGTSISRMRLAAPATSASISG